MNPTEVVKLTQLMAMTPGSPDIVVGIIDGPVATDHPGLANATIRSFSGACTRANSIACTHGTFVAGILAARRDFAAPAICPGCTFLVRPIFAETGAPNKVLPSAAPDELANAIRESIAAGAHILNLSIALARLSNGGSRELEETLDYASKKNVLVVAAAGNQGEIGSSTITRHAAVIPVVAYDLQGRLVSQSNLGISIGRRGLGAPGDEVTSLNALGGTLTLAGTSVATAFVTGAAALLWSLFPKASATQVRLALLQASASRRTTVIPPLLNAWRAYELISQLVLSERTK